MYPHRVALSPGVRGRGTWIALVVNPYPLQTRSVSNYPATVSVAKQSWMNAAYGPPLKTYVSHFDPVIGM